MDRFKIDENGTVIFYGNTAGYVKDKVAHIDEDFDALELKRYLKDMNFEIKFESGVFDKLSKGISAKELSKEELKLCRIWQFKKGTPPEKRFIGFDDYLKKYGEPDRKDYEPIYDGQIGTNDLETIFFKCNVDRPKGYNGHSMAISDVIELYDDKGSKFYYVNTVGFKEIQFSQEEQKQTMEEITI